MNVEDKINKAMGDYQQYRLRHPATPTRKPQAVNNLTIESTNATVASGAYAGATGGYSSAPSTPIQERPSSLVRGATTSTTSNDAASATAAGNPATRATAYAAANAAAQGYAAKALLNAIATGRPPAPSTRPRTLQAGGTGLPADSSSTAAATSTASTTSAASADSIRPAGSGTASSGDERPNYARPKRQLRATVTAVMAAQALKEQLAEARKKARGDTMRNTQSVTPVGAATPGFNAGERLIVTDSAPAPPTATAAAAKPKGVQPPIAPMQTTVVLNVRRQEGAAAPSQSQSLLAAPSARASQPTPAAPYGGAAGPASTVLTGVRMGQSDYRAGCATAVESSRAVVGGHHTSSMPQQQQRKLAVEMHVPGNGYQQQQQQVSYSSYMEPAAPKATAMQSPYRLPQQAPRGVPAVLQQHQQQQLMHYDQHEQQEEAGCMYGDFTSTAGETEQEEELGQEHDYELYQEPYGLGAGYDRAEGDTSAGSLWRTAASQPVHTRSAQESRLPHQGVEDLQYTQQEPMPSPAALRRQRSRQRMEVQSGKSAQEVSSYSHIHGRKPAYGYGQHEYDDAAENERPAPRQSHRHYQDTMMADAADAALPSMRRDSTLRYSMDVQRSPTEELEPLFGVESDGINNGSHSVGEVRGRDSMFTVDDPEHTEYDLEDSATVAQARPTHNAVEPGIGYQARERRYEEAARARNPAAPTLKDPLVLHTLAAAGLGSCPLTTAPSDISGRQSNRRQPAAAHLGVPKPRQGLGGEGCHDSDAQSSDSDPENARPARQQAQQAQQIARATETPKRQPQPLSPSSTNIQRIGKQAEKDCHTRVAATVAAERIAAPATAAARGTVSSSQDNPSSLQSSGDALRDKVGGRTPSRAVEQAAERDGAATVVSDAHTCAESRVGPLSTAATAGSTDDAPVVQVMHLDKLRSGGFDTSMDYAAAAAGDSGQNPRSGSSTAYYRRPKRAYRPSLSKNEDAYDYAIVVRVLPAHKQAAIEAEARARAEAALVARAQMISAGVSYGSNHSVASVEYGRPVRMPVPLRRAAAVASAEEKPGAKARRNRLQRFSSADTELDDEDDMEFDYDEDRSVAHRSKQNRGGRRSSLSDHDEATAGDDGDSASDSDDDALSDSTTGAEDEEYGTARRKPRRSILSLTEAAVSAVADFAGRARASLGRRLSSVGADSLESRQSVRAPPSGPSPKTKPDGSPYKRDRRGRGADNAADSGTDTRGYDSAAADGRTSRSNNGTPGSTLRSRTRSRLQPEEQEAVSVDVRPELDVEVDPDGSKGGESTGQSHKRLQRRVTWSREVAGEVIAAAVAADSARQGGEPPADKTSSEATVPSAATVAAKDPREANIVGKRANWKSNVNTSVRSIDSEVSRAGYSRPGYMTVSKLIVPVPEQAVDNGAAAKIHKCSEIIAALRAAGLQAKRVRSLSRRTWLIKIRAPEWRLEIEAEKLRLRMRRRDGGWSRFKRSIRHVFMPSVPDEDYAGVNSDGEVEGPGEYAAATGAGTHPADEDDGNGVFGSLTGVDDEGGDLSDPISNKLRVPSTKAASRSPEAVSLFHSSDRQTLIDHILRSSAREGGADLGEGTPLGAFVEQMFPLHMQARLDELRSDWLRFWRPHRSWGAHDRIGLMNTQWYTGPKLIDVGNATVLDPAALAAAQGLEAQSTNGSSKEPAMMSRIRKSLFGAGNAAASEEQKKCTVASGETGASKSVVTAVVPHYSVSGSREAAQGFVDTGHGCCGYDGGSGCVRSHGCPCCYSSFGVGRCSERKRAPCRILQPFYCCARASCRCGRSTGRLCGRLLSQPLDRIAAYFGEAVAFYFAWTEFYTQWLVLPAIAGLLLFLSQVYSRTLDVQWVPLFSLFMAVWSILFLEFWKRRNAELAQRWGVLNYEDEETVRPQFYGQWRQDAMTGALVRVYPRWKRIAKYAVTVPVMLSFAAGMVMLMILVFSTRDRLLTVLESYSLQVDARQNWIAEVVKSGNMTLAEAQTSVPAVPAVNVDVFGTVAAVWRDGLSGFIAVTAPAYGNMTESVSSASSSSSSSGYSGNFFSLTVLAEKLSHLQELFYNYRDWRWWLIMVLPPVAFGLLMPLFDILFSKLATTFNNWENHATESVYRNHRIAKVFFYRFISSFISLFYYAFAPQHSLVSLFVQIAAFLVVRQTVNTILEISATRIARSFREWRFRRRVRNAEDSGLTEGRRGRRLLRHATSQAWAEARMPVHDTFEDYAEQLVQFGYVTFFSWAFPLAPLCSLINNVFEMRKDAYKLCNLKQRPIAHKAGGIGVWYNVLIAMSLLAVLTNCAHLALSSKQFRAFFPDFTETQRLLIIFIIEHCVLALRLITVYIIPPTSAAVKNRMARDAWALAKIQGRRSVGSIGISQNH